MGVVLPLRTAADYAAIRAAEAAGENREQQPKGAASNPAAETVEQRGRRKLAEMGARLGWSPAKIGEAQANAGLGQAQPQPAAKTPRGKLMVTWASEMQPRLFAGGTLIKGLLDEGAMSVIYGASGSGKSFFCLDLAFHVALGMPWRGHKIRKQGCVLYLAAEGGVGIINRVAVLKRHDLQPDASIPLAAVTCPIDLLNPNADVIRIIELMEECRMVTGLPVVMTVVDTLSRVMAGGDENGPKDMTQFVANIDSLRAADCGAHCMVVHHSGKDILKGARGHNSLRAATDTEIEIARTGEGTDKSAVASIKKQRDMPGEEAFTFNLKSVLLGYDEDGDAVTSGVVVHTEQQEPGEQPRRGPQLRKRPELSKATLQMDKLVDLIEVQGETVNFPDCIPDGVRVTTLDRWKEALNDGGLLGDGTTKARSEQFRKAREKALGDESIGVWKDYVWLNWDVDQTAELTKRIASSCSRRTSSEASQTPLVDNRTTYQSPADHV